MIRKNTETYYPKYLKFQILAPICGAIYQLGELRPQRIFVGTCFSKPLGGGKPLGPILALPKALFVLEDFGSKFALKFKDSEQQSAQTTPLSKKQAQTLSIPSPNETLFTFVVLQSRVSPKPQVLKEKGRCQNDAKRTPNTCHCEGL